MLEKRLVGVVTVRDGWAVQSFGYGRYLPLGHPEVLVANLDRWGADEILLQCIDRSRAASGPDLELLAKVSSKGLSTPLIYAGGIRNAADAVGAVKAGADRVCLDALLHVDLPAALEVAEPLGAQAVIAALPLSWSALGVQWLDYARSHSRPPEPAVLEALRRGAISEALVIDWQADGRAGAFDTRLLESPVLQGIPLIAFGGLSDAAMVHSVLSMSNVVAVAQGNFLNYREHAVQALKEQLQGLPVRPAEYRGAGSK